MTLEDKKRNFIKSNKFNLWKNKIITENKNNNNYSQAYEFLNQNKSKNKEVDEEYNENDDYKDFIINLDDVISNNNHYVSKYNEEEEQQLNSITPRIKDESIEAYYNYINNDNNNNVNNVNNDNNNINNNIDDKENANQIKINENNKNNIALDNKENNKIIQIDNETPDHKKNHSLQYKELMISKLADNEKKCGNNSELIKNIHLYYDNLEDNNLKSKVENNKEILNNKTQNENEEINRLNYLLSSKNFKEEDAKNIIDLQKTINDVVKKTNNTIQTIHSQSDIQKNQLKESQKNQNMHLKKSKSEIQILQNTQKNFEIEKIEKISLNMSVSQKNNIIATPLKVENIFITGNKNKNDSNTKVKKYKLLLRQTVNNEFFEKKNIAINKISNRETFNIINNSQISFGKTKVVDINSKTETIKIENEKVNNPDVLNEYTNGIDRIINEEMVERFLINTKNEGIFSCKKDKNKKYLGFALDDEYDEDINNKLNLKQVNKFKNNNKIKIDRNSIEENISNNIPKKISNSCKINCYNNKYKNYVINIQKKEEHTNNNNSSINFKNISDIKNNTLNLNKSEITISNILDMDISNSNNNINNYISNDQLQKKLCNDYEELFKKLSVQTTPYLKKNNKKVPYRKRNLNFDQYKKVNYNNSNEKSFSLIDMNFMERMEHFNNKKTNDIQKMQNYLTNIESYIHTFHPEMNSKSKNIVNIKNLTKSNSKQKTENVNNKKLINYDRINELYLDYKNRNIKIKKLTKENDIKNGITFKPYFIDYNQQMKKYKEKIGNIPYLNRLDIYSGKGLYRKRLTTSDKERKTKNSNNKSFNLTTSKRKYK